MGSGEVMANTPPPPPGFKLDTDIPPPPAGFTMDAPKEQAKPKLWDSKSSDDDIIKALGYDPAVLKKSKFYSDGMFSRITTDPGTTVSKETSGPLFSAIKGAANVGMGFDQIVRRGWKLAGVLSDADVQMVDANKKFVDLEYERSHTQLGNKKATGLAKGILNASEFVGESLPTLFPGGPTLSGVKLLSGQGVKQLGKIAAVGAGTALTQPVTVDPNDPYSYLKAKAKQVVASVFMAPAAQLGIERGAVPAAKFLAKNNLLARIFGNKAAREAAIERVEAIRTSTQSPSYPQGAEPSLGEALQNPGLNALENKAEYIPFSGRRAQLEKGNKALYEKLKSMADQEKPGLGIAGAGPEIAESASGKLASAKAEFKEPYGFVRDVVGDTPPVRTSTLKAFDDAITKEIGISGKNSPEVKALSLARDNFSKGETGRNFADMEAIQDRLQYDAAHSSTSPDPGQKALGRYARDISRGVGEDMHATIALADPTGFASDIYRSTNKSYGSKVRRFDPNQAAGPESTKKAAQTFVAPEGFEGTIPDKLFARDNPEMAKYAREALDERGAKAVRAEIMRRALDAGEDSKIFSPNKAANVLDKHENFIKEFFNPQEAKQIEGFKNALRDMQRSGQYLEQVTTGKFAEQAKSMTAPLTAVGAAIATKSVIPLVIGAGGMTAAKLYTKLSGTKAGKEWLLGMAKTKPNSLLMKTLMNQLPKIVGTKAGEEPTQEQK